MSNETEKVDTADEEAEVQSNKEIVDKINNYKKGVLEAIGKKDKDGKALGGIYTIDFSTNVFGITEVIDTAGKPNILISRLKTEVRDRYPDENDVDPECTTIAIRFESAKEIALLENWITVAKADIIRNLALEKTVIDDNKTTTKK
jgi:hypothetical protein